MGMTWCAESRSFDLLRTMGTDVSASRRIAWALLALTVVSCASSGSSTRKASDEPEVKSFVFKHEGIVREVAVFDPRATPEGAPRPMVIVLHGGLGTTTTR